MKEPVSAIVFDVLGGVIWLATIIAIYIEETAGAGIKADTLNGMAEAARVMRAQAILLELACTGAIVGTLFLGFAAILKMQARAVRTADERAIM